MATIINASNSTGLTLTSDLSGALAIQGSGVTAVNINASGVATQPLKPAFLAGGTGNNTSYTAGSVILFPSLSSTFVSSARSAGYNTATSAYTAPVAGLYQFYMQIYCGTNPTSVAWRKNGTQLDFPGDAALATYSVTGVNQLLNGTTIIDLAAGDYIQVGVRTGASTISVYGGHSCFWGVLIG